MHQGQIDGGVVTAIGYALMEQLVIEQGKVITANFGEKEDSVDPRYSTA